MRKEPVAIIATGGGMHCAYSAGALVALGKKLGLTDPDIAVASSGGCGNIFYYLANQYDDIQKAWLQYLPSPNFVRYFPVPRIRVDYLVDEVFKKLLPLHVDQVVKSDTRWFIPITDSETGETRFVSNDTFFDPHEMLRAAMAVPILYSKWVPLGLRKYLDGDFGTGVVNLVEEAAKQGAKKIILISSHVPPSRFTKNLYYGYAHLERAPLRKTIIATADRGDAVKAPDGTELLVISPTVPFPMSVASRNRRLVAETFYMGHDDLLARRDEIEKFFAD